MPCRVAHPGLIRTGLQKEVGNRLGAAVHVSLVFLLRTDRRDTQDGEEFLEETLTVLFDVFFHYSVTSNS